MGSPLATDLDRGHDHLNKPSPDPDTKEPSGKTGTHREINHAQIPKHPEHDRHVTEANSHPSHRWIEG